MRIHWSVAIISALGVMLLTWHLRIRDFDFMTPKGVQLPPEDFGDDLQEIESSAQPPIAQEFNPGEITQPTEDGPEVPEIPEIEPTDLGDLESSPGLSAYREFAREHDAADLFLLSSTLRSQGEFQRALLALERVVDASEATPEQLLEAGKGIAALTPTLPRWNIDPTSEVQLTLEIGIPKTEGDSLKNAALDLATLIRLHSGDILDVIPKINTSESEAAMENPPIALWFSSGETDGKSSAVMTITPSGDPEELLNEFSLAAFQAARSHLTKLGFRPPPPLTATGVELISRQITRLMWRDFAASLHEKKEEPVEETIDEGN